MTIDINNTPKDSIKNLIKSLSDSNEKLREQTIGNDLECLLAQLNQLKGEKKIYEYKPKLGREICRQKKSNCSDNA